jgi:cytochrome c oxidase subunit I
MMAILNLGLIRGLLAGILAGGIGAGLTALARLGLGLAPLEAGPLTFFGCIAGLIGFLIGVGAFRDWWRWGRGGTAEEPPLVAPPGPAWRRYFDFDTNHKIIGIQYAVTSFVLMGVAGVMALLVRTELSQSGMQLLTPDSYNTVMGIHGIVMIAVILIGIGGMANYLTPLMLGANDMAFPRLNAFAFWLLPPAAIFVLASMAAGGFDTGWTGYPPLGVYAPLGAQFFYLGVFILGLSSILGSVNIITTILKMRAPGMGMFRMPIFVWAVLATSLIQLVATQFIGMAFLMVLSERLLGMGFFDPASGGNPVLFQHLFWFYSHPVVYVFVLPGFGIISELLPVFARKPLFGYRWVALSSMAISFVGFLVWAHHMFATGLGTILSLVFMFSTLLVAVPTGVKIFSWLATLWGGKLSFETPMLFVLGAIIIFLMGGLTGPFLALVPTDLYLTETYWVVSHFHQTMFGGFMFPFVASIYFWFPKVTGYRYSERLGVIHFWLMSVGFGLITGPMYVVGLKGMLRRVADYEPLPGFELLNILATVGAGMVALSMVLLVVNLLRSMGRKERAPANPWRSRTLEWQIASPPPEVSFPTPPTIVGGPYDYGVKGSVYARLGPASEDDHA